jgi:hypothetical protein
MKTAMQQHIEWLKATLDICKENAPTLVNCINLCISDSESRLGTEKEQIENACMKWYDGSNDNAGEQYYNETFNKSIKNKG